MNDEIVAAFQESTSLVFRTMLGLEITPGEIQDRHSTIIRHEVSGIIGLSGALAGDVIVSFDEQVAIRATGVLLGQEPGELDNDVVDAVGELTNMIAGSAKGILESYNMRLALPTVILGKGHRVGFKSGVDPIAMPFESPWGTIHVEVGLVEVEAGVVACGV